MRNTASADASLEGIASMMMARSDPSTSHGGITLWNYSSTTNHVLQSVLARLSHSAWRWFAQPGGLRLSEAAIRLPSYVAGILIVPLLALLMARFGFALGGSFRGMAGRAASLAFAICH